MFVQSVILLYFPFCYKTVYRVVLMNHVSAVLVPHVHKSQPENSSVIKCVRYRDIGIQGCCWACSSDVWVNCFHIQTVWDVWVWPHNPQKFWNCELDNTTSYPTKMLISRETTVRTSNCTRCRDFWLKQTAVTKRKVRFFKLSWPVFDGV
jgi:hypothetical protein